MENIIYISFSQLKENFTVILMNTDGYITQSKPRICINLRLKHSVTGKETEKSTPSGLKEDTENISVENDQMTEMDQHLKLLDNKFATAVSVLEDSSMTLNGKNITCLLDILAIALSETLGQVLILTEKDLIPFWTSRSKEISKRLWLPIQIDSAASVFPFSKDLSNTEVGGSWFSIKRATQLLPLQEKNLWKTFWPSLHVLPPKSTVSDLPVSKDQSQPAQERKKKRKIVTRRRKCQVQCKTMKFRFFPNDQQKKALEQYREYYRYYYNMALEVWNTKVCAHTDDLRDELRKYTYIYTDDPTHKGKLHKNQQQNSYFIPKFWQNADIKVHNRVIRGAVHKLVGAIESAQSNLEAGNNNVFTIHFKSKKQEESKNSAITFDDHDYPNILKQIAGRFGYRIPKDQCLPGQKRRCTITPQQVIKETGKRGCTFVYEKCTDRYFLHYPVPVDYYPKNDQRGYCHENQVPTDLVALDPGVRKFLTGYSPQGQTLTIGQAAHHVLGRDLLKIDQEADTVAKARRWCRVKNRIDDLHWKTIKYLTDHYGVIFLGDIKTGGMMGGKKLQRLTKRILGQYSFYQFKSRLSWKASSLGRKLILVDEAYTSKTCCGCGRLSNVGGSEVYRCVNSDCGLVLDRDLNGAVCILIKALTKLLRV